MRKLLATLTVAGLAVAFGASPGVAGSGNVKKFCKANLGINKLFNETEADFPEDTDRLNTLLDRAINNAPPDIADAVDVAAPALQEDGPAAFDDPAVQEAIGEIDDFALNDCGYEKVEATLEDYAFTGIPDEIETGTVAFELTNEGTEVHEMIVFRFKGDETLDEILELPEEEAMERVTTVGFGFALPDEITPAFIQFKKTGRYAAICTLPVGATDPEQIETLFEAGAAPHFTEGMATEFEVVK